MSVASLCVLGGFQARLSSGTALVVPSRKARALLAYLAVTGQIQPRDKLAALLWGDVADERARHSLRQVLVALRRALQPAAARCLVEFGDGVGLVDDAVDVDVHAFERLVDDGSPSALERAVEIYQGDLLEGLAVTEAGFEEWLLSERERLRERALDALARLLVHDKTQGDMERAVNIALRLLALDPLQESVHRTLMRLYANQRRRAAALRQYQVCVGVLQRELGVEPEPETRLLYQAILQSRGAPAAPLRPRRSRPSAGGDEIAQREALPVPDAPLVGREAERGRLTEVLAAAWRGRGRIAAVVGEAGIGKTRLVADLVSEAASAGRVLLGRAFETQQALPLGPWVEAIRTGGVIGEVRWADLPAPCQAELARVFPELGVATAAVPPGPEAYLRLFEAFAQLLQHLALERPLLIVLEDLHWADEMTLRLLPFVGRRLGESPVLFVVTAREEDLAAAPALRQALAELERDGDLVRVALVPLSVAETTRLIEALVQTGTARAVVARLQDQIWATSEGNPFVVVETMRAVQEGGWEDRRPLTLPRPVRETIAGRLARLGERARRLVAVAALVGREFEFTLVQRAAGLEAAEAAEAVEELVARRFLQVIGEELDFSHERIREVAHDSLLPPRRRVLHAALARELERLYSDRLDEVYDRLAAHYSGGDEPGRAAEYFLRLGKKSADAYAHAAAAAAFDRAATLFQAVPDRDRRVLDARLQEAFSLSVLGRFGDILTRLEAEAPRMDRLDDPRLKGPYFLRLGLTCTYLGGQDQAARHAERALAEAGRCGDDATTGKAHYVLSLRGYYSGRLRAGVEHGRQAVALLAGAQEPHWLGLAYFVLGVNHHVLGEFERALEAEARTRSIGTETGDRRLQSLGEAFMGWALATQGDWAAGIAACRRGVELAPDPVTLALASSRLGFAALEGADVDTAVVSLEGAAEQLRRIGYRQVEGQVLGRLAEAYERRGEHEQATTVAREGLRIVREDNFVYAIALTERTLALIARESGDLVAARSGLEHVRQTFERMDAAFELARTHIALAEVAADQGDRSAAVEHVASGRMLAAALATPVLGPRLDFVEARVRGGDPLELRA